MIEAGLASYRGKWMRSIGAPGLYYVSCDHVDLFVLFVDDEVRTLSSCML
jgi:hypothetical protein